MYIHWTFSLLLIWVIANHLNDGGDTALITYKVLFLFAVFGCVLLHELGHALSALRYGIHTHDITLLPIGGVARLERIPEKPLQELIVAAAGPAVNVFIALIIALILLITGGFPADFDPALIQDKDLLLNLLIVNISLVIFNLIPAFPMDGGRMLRALMSLRIRRDKATAYAALLGQLLAIGFMVLGFFYNPVLLFIGVFIFMGARQESAYVKRTEQFKRVRVEEIMDTSFPTLQETESIKAAIDKLIHSGRSDFLVLDEQGEMKGILTRDNLLQGIAHKGIDSSVASLITYLPGTVNSKDTAVEVYRIMMKTNTGLLAVKEDKQVRGLISAAAIREYFLTKYAVELNTILQNSRV